jgi:hypothetical protein
MEFKTQVLPTEKMPFQEYVSHCHHCGCRHKILVPIRDKAFDYQRAFKEAEEKLSVLMARVQEMQWEAERLGRYLPPRLKELMDSVRMKDYEI